MPQSRATTKPLAVAFGARLRSVRTEKSWTQEFLAQKAGLHPTYISNCERGYSSPTLETLLRLADALEVRPGVLVDDLGETPGRKARSS